MTPARTQNAGQERDLARGAQWLREADAVWRGRLSRAIDDPRSYRTLSDSVLTEIQWSTDPALAKAKARARVCVGGECPVGVCE